MKLLRMVLRLMFSNPTTMIDPGSSLDYPDYFY